MTSPETLARQAEQIVLKYEQHLDNSGAERDGDELRKITVRILAQVRRETRDATILECAAFIRMGLIKSDTALTVLELQRVIANALEEKVISRRAQGGKDA